MSLDITSLDAYFLSKELKHLEGARMDKIYQLSSKDFLFTLHKEGKHLLRAILGKAFYLASDKPEVPEITSFCKHIRKKLSNVRINKIHQMDFDRILVFELDNDHLLIFEFFGKGNLLLIDKEGVIQVILERQKWANRELKQGEKYVAGTEKIKITNKAEVVKGLTSAENKEKFIASQLGFGKKYAKEVVKADESPEQIYKRIQELLNKELSPRIYKDGNKLHIVPFDMENIKGESMQFQTLSEAYEYAHNQFYAETPENIAKKKYEAKKERLNTIIKAQEKQLKNIDITMEENQKIGNNIYEKYQELSEVFELLKNSEDFESIVQQLKAEGKIKSANKKGEVEIEL